MQAPLHDANTCKPLSATYAGPFLVRRRRAVTPPPPAGAPPSPPPAHHVAVLWLAGRRWRRVAPQKRAARGCLPTFLLQSLIQPYLSQGGWAAGKGVRAELASWHGTPIAHSCAARRSQSKRGRRPARPASAQHSRRSAVQAQTGGNTLSMSSSSCHLQQRQKSKLTA